MCRFSAILIIGAAVFASTFGCNSDMRCRRETALLRAEILDLEDKYYALKSEHESTLSGAVAGGDYGSGAIGTGVVNSGMFNSGGMNQGVVIDGYVQAPVVQGDIVYDDVVYDGQVINNGQVFNGQVIDGQIIDGPVISGPSYPTDGVVYGQPMYGQPMMADGSVYYEGAQFEGGGAIESINGTPVDGGIFLGPADEPTIDSTILPGLSPTSAGSVLQDEDGVEPSPGTNSYDEQTSSSLDSPDFEVSFQAETAEPEMVTGIEINPTLSRGEDLDGKLGDEGLNLLLQPKSKFGSVIDQAGTVSVVVTDPTIATGSQQIGQWTFLPHETELFLSRDEFDQRGILLHLPWQGKTPQGTIVNVNVQFITNDGREMEDSKSIQISPPPIGSKPTANQNLITGWTARDQRWLSDPEHNVANRSAGAPRTLPSQPRFINRAQTQRNVSTQNNVNKRWRSQGDSGQFIRSSTPIQQSSPVRSGSASRPAVKLPEWKPTR